VCAHGAAADLTDRDAGDEETVRAASAPLHAGVGFVRAILV
jgi:hypothetical protein